MKAVCLCCEVHVPYDVKWYWPEEGYSKVEFENYFDQYKIYSRFEKFVPHILSINEALLESMDRGASYTFDISGIFLDQCRLHPAVIDSFRDLKNRGAELACSPYFHSVASLFPDKMELREQVKMHRMKLKELFKYEPKTFINSELLLAKDISPIISQMGFKCYISEGSENLLGKKEPVYVYVNDMPTLLRHIDLSEDIEDRFSDTEWVCYPLIADKFASWIANMDGDVVTLFFNYGSLIKHHKKQDNIIRFLIELPKSLQKHGIEMILPETAVDTFGHEPLETLKTNATSRYGLHNLVGNHIQHLYLYELIDIGKMLHEIRDSPGYHDLVYVYRCLQQSEILLEMGPENTHLGAERAVNVFSVISDLKRAILEEKK
ncbi:alpha-amlyase [Methanohalophilus halophilus]|uniref:Alpha-amlyase n=2 Tax=Methanohalophilus halophilus TaxID=2177 RepID=A0A1L3Q539_9EURY|nr:glycoside hydrolase family 57 protein [Methanohalophilus halophilus]APH39989.1 alpha-amlyase [Methanohalophilus halophilus]RNI09186.1 alpha-amlyase [Methanohalophilus halophilus]SDW37914.1 alpha-amylase [Methanohalophilus halophilus]